MTNIRITDNFLSQCRNYRWCRQWYRLMGLKWIRVMFSDFIVTTRFEKLLFIVYNRYMKMNVFLYVSSLETQKLLDCFRYKLYQWISRYSVDVYSLFFF